MNWKEHAPLFANGKFQARINWDDGTTQERIITGYYNESDRGECFTFEATYLPIEMCTLIARPISDMGNVEVITALEHQDIEHEGRDFKFYNTWLEGCVNEWKDYDDDWDKERLSAGCQNYLLSIGVYPFSQDHFDAGEVINTNPIKE